MLWEAKKLGLGKKHQEQQKLKLHFLSTSRVKCISEGKCNLLPYKESGGKMFEISFPHFIN